MNQLRLKPNVNLEQIKKMGAFLGLEAELSVQNRGLQKAITEKRWSHAATSCENILEVLNEITAMTTPCDQQLTSTETASSATTNSNS